MNIRDELGDLDQRVKWNKWVYRQQRKTMPVVNYLSAFIFTLATIVEASGPFS